MMGKRATQRNCTPLTRSTSRLLQRSSRSFPPRAQLWEGDTVQIVTNGIPSGSIPSIRFDEEDATVTGVLGANGVLEVISPPGEPGWAAVELTDWTESIALSEAFLYQHIPVLEDVIPDSGDVAGGELIRLVGDAMDQVSTVWVGALPCPSRSWMRTAVWWLKLRRVRKGRQPCMLETPEGIYAFPKAYTYTSPTLAIYATRSPGWSPGWRANRSYSRVQLARAGHRMVWKRTGIFLHVEEWGRA